MELPENRPTEHIPTTREENPQESPSRQLEASKKLIRRWDSTASEEARDRMIFDGERQEVERYLVAVDEIRRSMEAASVSGEGSGKDIGTIQIAMSRLEDEFRNILIAHSSSLDINLAADSIHSSVSSSRTRISGEFYEDDDEDEEDRDQDQDQDSSSSYRKSMDSIRDFDQIPGEVISDLHDIAESMVLAGYSRECVQAYGSVRKPVVDAGFRQLGIEKLSIGDIQRIEWDALEAKIRKWIHAARICIRVLFSGEKWLCERIFDGLDPADDTCFMETVKGSAIHLFNFVEAISISRRSPEKLFKILDLHEALSDLQPDIAAIFCSKSSESVTIQAAEILSRLAEAARGILSEFENAIQRESSRIPVPGGTVHPLTRYVMNYINLISDYRQTLIQLIVTKPSPGSRFSGYPTPEINSQGLDADSPLAAHIIWIIIILQLNLENKSKLYRDSSLSHLFLMNNVHYIVQKVKGSPELRELISDDWLKKLTGKYQQAAINYERATWVRILSCLRDEGIHVSGSFSSGVSKTALKERFKNFNSSFEEVHRVQATWSIPDPQLREELRISIAAKLLPAYRSFLGRFRHHLETIRHSEMYIKYSAEDLESALLNFFEGSPVTHHVRRGSC